MKHIDHFIGSHVPCFPSPVFCLLTAVSCLLSSLPSLALEPAEQLQFADGLYSRGMWDTALKEYQGFLDRNPDRKAEAEPVYYRMGESYRALGRTNEADAAYRRAYDDYPNGEFHYRAGLRRAEIFEQAGQGSEQVHLLMTMLTGTPPPELGAACRYALGAVLEKQGKTAEAAEAYDAVIKNYPGTPYVSYSALALAGLNRKAGGARCADLYRLAATNAVSPRVGAEAWFQLGDFHFRAKDYEASARAYEQLAARYPADERVVQARLQQARALYNAKRFADAWALCTAARQASPSKKEETSDESSGGRGLPSRGSEENAPEWLYLKANCELQLLKNEEAAATYATLLKSYPDSPLAGNGAYERALAFFRLGRFVEAIEQAKGLPANESIRRDVYWLLGESYAAVKDDAGAVQNYKLLVDHYPASPLAGDALYRLAHLLQKKGDFVQASELFARLAADFPAHELAAQALFAQASCLGKAKKEEQAVAVYGRLLEKFPKSAFVEDSLYQKATAETYLRRDAQAMESWRDLQARFPATKYAADARFWNGVLLEENNKLEEAEAAFLAALKATPVPAEEFIQRIQFRLALVLQRRGTKLKEAADLLQGLLATPMRDKFPPALLEWLADFRNQAREFDKGLPVMELLLTQATTDNWRQIAWCLKGKALLGQGKGPEAKVAFEHVVGINFKSQAMAEAWLKLGELILAEGDSAKAKTAFEEAATLAASDILLAIRVQAYAGIGKALKAQGDQAGAARLFMSVAVLFDDPVLVPECLAGAAQAFTATGKKADAEKALKELKERYPDSPWLKQGAGGAK